ncbi:MAG: hypothetical protein M3313_09695 [Actinomycetota bacterium]|nr:hypothetical protein [Actinomycetota bacterium]
MMAMRYLSWPPAQFRLTGAPRLRRSMLAAPLNPIGWMCSGTAWALLQAALLIALLLLISGAGRPAVALPGRGDPATARAVEVLIEAPATGIGRRAELISIVPADFAAVMGYRPALIDINGSLSLGKPIGACSSPVNLAFDMEPTCMGHDFGYDLLRYAAAIGAPLGDWARPLIDHWWYGQMHQRCDLAHSGGIALACHAQVLTTEAIIDVNSWREGDGPPIEENPWRYLGALVLLPVSLVGMRRLRRGDPFHPGSRLQTAPAVSGLRARN